MTFLGGDFHPEEICASRIGSFPQKYPEYRWPATKQRSICWNHDYSISLLPLLVLHLHPLHRLPTKIVARKGRNEAILLKLLRATDLLQPEINAKVRDGSNNNNNNDISGKSWKKFNKNFFETGMAHWLLGGSFRVRTKTHGEEKNTRNTKKLSDHWLSCFSFTFPYKKQSPWDMLLHATRAIWSLPNLPNPLRYKNPSSDTHPQSARNHSSDHLCHGQGCRVSLGDGHPTFNRESL